MVLQVGKALLGAIRGALRLPVATDKADSKLVEELGFGGLRGASTQARRTTFEDAPPEVEQPHAGSEPGGGGGGGGKLGPISGDDIGGDFADFEVGPPSSLLISQPIPDLGVVHRSLHYLSRTVGLVLNVII